MSTILIISPDETLRNDLGAILALLPGCSVRQVERGADALATLRKGLDWVVLVDLRNPACRSEMDALLAHLDDLSHQACVQVIGITERGYPRIAWRWLDRLVTGCIMTPICSDSLLRLLSRDDDGTAASVVSVEQRSLLANGWSFTTRTSAMFPLLGQLERVAARDVPLLLTGETGTGKSYLARLIHELSGRRSGPFFATACGALPPDLIESELFGHVRGAFTSAVRSSVGRFEAARGGTLLLDEIDVLGAKEQSRLLHVIETGKYEPVGSTDTKMADVRLIVASNVDLKRLAERHQFRADLYYRLNVLEFHLPPLRQRPTDIVPLAIEFIDDTCQRHSIPITHMSSDFLLWLKQYHWPGNIRELLNQMRRAVLLSKDGVLTTDSLSLDLRTEVCESEPESQPKHPVRRPAGWNLNRRLACSEREFLVETLRAHNNNRAATARALGISRTALYKKMQRLGVGHGEEGLNAASLTGMTNQGSIIQRS
jgi:two-component system, NtrC family, response regulator AtoC